MPPDPHDPLLGAFVGPYRVERKLGEGGMGAVYEVLNPAIGRRIALKVLHAEFAADPGIARRFQDEARAAARVKHPNLIEVYDFGAFPDGRQYILMELLAGESLAALLRRQGRLSPGDARDLLVPLCDVLAAVHDAGVVHRDLKPDNVHLVPRPDNPRFIKVLDFGVARLRGDGPPAERTKSGLLLGTPRYMAPEQALARSSEIDQRTDVYALGVVAFEMLTGSVPFTAESFGDLLLQQVYEAPPRPSALRPDLDPAWDELLLRGLAKRREDRFQSMRELGAAVARAGAAARVSAVGTPPRPPVQVGRYRVGERLGGGGMAEVFRATLTGVEGFQRVYALKRIASHLSADEAFAGMFIEEARLSAQLNHANIVATLDFDRDADGCLYLAMELVDGRDLRQLTASGPIPVGVAAFVTAELLRALEYAHTATGPGGRPLGIVHRDVSPHNVLLSWDGHVKLSDFGIAKAYAATGASNSGSLRGKVAYMSPEQARGLPLDGRADLFAVGVMLHEMLTGERLFGGGTDAEAFARMLTMEIAAPRSLREGIPADLDAVAMKLLERDRERRFAGAGAALEALLSCAALSSRGSVDLAALLRERFGPAPGRASAPQPAVGTRPTPTVAGEVEARARRRRRTLGALAAVVVAAAATVVAAIALRPPARGRAAAPSAAAPASAAVAPTAAPAAAAAPAGPPAAVPAGPAAGSPAGPQLDAVARTVPGADAGAPATVPALAPDAGPPPGAAKPKAHHRRTRDDWEVPRQGGSPDEVGRPQ